MRRGPPLLAAEDVKTDEGGEVNLLVAVEEATEQAGDEK